MKICLLTHTFPRFSEDTAAPFMHGVAGGLAAAGNKVFVLTPFSSKFQKDWIESRNYKVVTYRYIFPTFFHKLGYSETLSNDKSLKFVAYLLSPFMYFFGTLALFKLVRKEKIDVINAHWILPNGFMAALVSKFTGVPVVSTLPGSDVYMAGKNFLFRRMAKFAADNSQFITSNSPRLIGDLKDITKVRQTKYREIIYGVDAKKFTPGRNFELRRKLNIKDGQIVVLGVGRLVSKKGFKYLVQASKEVLRKNPEVKFVLVGDGDEKKALINLTTKMKINRSFSFLGSIDYKNLPDYYRMADIFVLPSVRDELGNLDDQSVSVVEAMSSGLPVITSDFPGYRLVIHDLLDGYLVAQRDTQQISNTLNKLISSPDLRKKMGAKARETASKKYSWENIGRQYSKLFAEAVAGDFYSKNIPKILNRKERIRIAKQIYTVVSHHLGSTAKLTCLDIGCSSGVITCYLARHFAYVIGVDVDREALRLAERWSRVASSLSPMSGGKLCRRLIRRLSELALQQESIR